MTEVVIRTPVQFSTKGPKQKDSSPDEGQASMSQREGAVIQELA